MKIKISIGFEFGITNKLAENTMIAEVDEEELEGKNVYEKTKYIYEKYVIPFRDEHHISMQYEEIEE